MQRGDYSEGQGITAQTYMNIICPLLYEISSPSQSGRYTLLYSLGAPVSLSTSDTGPLPPIN